MPIVTPERDGRRRRGRAGAGRGADRPGRRGGGPGRASGCSAARTAAGSWCSRQGQQRRRRPRSRPAASGPGACGCPCSTPPSAPAALPAADLVDRRRVRHRVPGRLPAAAPPPGRSVLAVDIPSGVDGLTGAAAGEALARRPHRHVRRAQAGPAVRARAATLAGEVEVADIGLDVSGASAHLVERRGRRRLAARPPADAHKWRARCGSWPAAPGMTGAAASCAAAAPSGPAPGTCGCRPPAEPPPGSRPRRCASHLPADGWADEVLAGLDRFRGPRHRPRPRPRRRSPPRIREVVAAATARGSRWWSTATA